MAKKIGIYDPKPPQVGDLPLSINDPVILPMKPDLPSVPPPEVVAAMQVIPPPVVFTQPRKLNETNESVSRKAIRRWLELLLETQQRGGDGHLTFDAYFTSGTMTREIRVRGDWGERL